MTGFLGILLTIHIRYQATRHIESVVPGSSDHRAIVKGDVINMSTWNLVPWEKTKDQGLKNASWNFRSQTTPQVVTMSRSKGLKSSLANNKGLASKNMAMETASDKKSIRLLETISSQLVKSQCIISGAKFHHGCDELSISFFTFPYIPGGRERTYPTLGNPEILFLQKMPKRGEACEFPGGYSDRQGAQ